ncbi:hypothetical protein [Hydrocarboniphaga sp.]|uniref:hypothetical protein n=1 Tax=Hydrocarboniphaga sp. TaxID=2033016 RepID=UPI003D141D38
MKPSDHTIDAAVMRIFRGSFVPVGGRIELQQLQLQWEQLKFRRGDLLDAIVRLEAGGRLRSQVINGQLFLAQRDDPNNSDLKPPTALAMLSRGMQALELSLINRRRRASGILAMQKRATDRGPQSTK